MFETERLKLRNFTLEDASFVYELMNSKGWIKNIGNRNINSLEDAEDYIRMNHFDCYLRYGYGPYLVTLKGTGASIGTAGLYKRENLEHPDIGFAFLPAYWNNGFAFEAAKAVLQYASEKLGITKISAITLPTNSSSIKLLKKLGLKEIGNYIYKDGENLLLFSN
ncbi:N-acetyltransferase [Aequorivita sp. H23M31]|uniref:N-acetyltransferase n=1 Tax=Aequorivita ciconiae TaxID=2494375 RepID=A0A410G2D1_9FLAO|nr:GNAT family N-acetyltransferase [Aequorivita sp. H23M31]QAA81444.1 N-acetyltransferase [Aequorivita sp. H23M31]